MDNLVPVIASVFVLILAILIVIAVWRVYAKAGQPGWACLVPIYNIYVLLKIIGRPGWWLLLYLLPIISIIISVVNALDLAKAFGKNGLFGFFLLWLFPVGYLILGFGNDKYIGISSSNQPASNNSPINPPMPPQPQEATPAQQPIQ